MTLKSWPVETSGHSPHHRSNLTIFLIFLFRRKRSSGWDFRSRRKGSRGWHFRSRRKGSRGWDFRKPGGKAETSGRQEERLRLQGAGRKGWDFREPGGKAETSATSPEMMCPHRTCPHICHLRIGICRGAASDMSHKLYWWVIKYRDMNAHYWSIGIVR